MAENKEQDQDEQKPKKEKAVCSQHLVTNGVAGHCQLPMGHKGDCKAA